MNFKLTDEQINAVNDWKSNHDQVYCGAIGGRYSFEFTPTGVGIIIVIKDNITNEKLDVTDYESF